MYVFIKQLATRSYILSSNFMNWGSILIIAKYFRSGEDAASDDERVHHISKKWQMMVELPT